MKRTEKNLILLIYYFGCTKRTYKISILLIYNPLDTNRTQNNSTPLIYHKLCHEQSIQIFNTINLPHFCNMKKIYIDTTSLIYYIVIIPRKRITKYKIRVYILVMSNGKNRK